MARGGIVAAVAAPAVVAGCQSGGGTAPQSPAPPSPAPTTTTPATAAPPTRSECANLVTSGQALATAVGQLIQGSASRDQVRAAATQLSAAIDSAQQSAGARLDDAKGALQRVLDAAGAQPPDVAGLRTATNDLLAALRTAADNCETPATPTTSAG